MSEVNKNTIADAASRGDLTMVNHFLSQGATEDDIDYAFLMAACNQHDEAMKVLLNYGANVTTANNKPLQMAIMYKNTKMLQIIMSNDNFYIHVPGSVELPEDWLFTYKAYNSTLDMFLNCFFSFEEKISDMYFDRMIQHAVDLNNIDVMFYFCNVLMQVKNETSVHSVIEKCKDTNNEDYQHIWNYIKEDVRKMKNNLIRLCNDIGDTDTVNFLNERC